MVKSQTIEPEIGEQEPVIIEYPNEGFTNAIGPCVGVAVLNHKKRKGYLSHVYSLGDVKSTIGVTIEKAIDESENVGDLEIALAGNIPSSREEIISFEEDPNLLEGFQEFSEDYFSEMREDAKNYKQLVEKYIADKKIPSKNIEMRLPNLHKDITYAIEINTKKGKIKIIEEPFDEDY